MPSKCFIQYVSKSERPRSGHRTRKGQSLSQFPRKVVLKNVQLSLHWTSAFISHAIIPLLYDKESWALKNWCSWTVVLEKTLESPLDCKEIQPVNPTGNQSWIFIGMSDAEPEAPILWPPDVKNWLLRKDPDAGKDWRQEEKGMTEDEMVGWHYLLYGHEFEQSLRVGDGQGSLVYYSPQGCKESDTTEWLNWYDIP